MVSISAALALYHPPSFTWFSGSLITLGLGGIMLGMGITLQWKDFKEVVRTPSWVLFGVALQFTVMPFLGWILGKIFELPPFFAVGLILVSCCPGGTASNVIAYLAKAHVALSVAMTAVSTFTAIIFTPILTAQLSGTYVDIAASGLFFSTLKVVLFPISTGILFNRYFPNTTQKCVPFGSSSGSRSNHPYCCQYHWSGKCNYFICWIAIALRPSYSAFLGFLVGFFFSYWLLKNPSVSKTIAIEVGMQNSGLGVVLAQENFTNPMTAIPAAMSSLVHSIYGSVFTVLFGQSNKKNSL